MLIVKYVHVQMLAGMTTFLIWRVTQDPTTGCILFASLYVVSPGWFLTRILVFHFIPTVKSHSTIFTVNLIQELTFKKSLKAQ